MDDFERELKVGFLEEASQLLNDVEQCFLQLETDPSDKAILEKIFRLAHNLKGSSRAVGFEELGKFTHEFESFLLKLKNGTAPVNPQTVGLLLRCNDHIVGIIEGLKTDLDYRVDSTALIDELRTDYSKEPEDVDDFQELAQLTKVEVEKVEVEKDETNQPAPVRAEAPLQPQSLPPPPVQTANKPSGENTVEESIRVSLNRVEKLIDYVGEMSILQTVITEQAEQANRDLLRKTISQMGKVAKEIQDLSMSLRMLPVKQTFQKMQRIVRDTSSSLGKKVELLLTGEETDLDKTVLEGIGDPLVHLIRNAVDHGIETPEVRTKIGKNPVGQIRLSAGHDAGRLVIEVSDDGGGIDGNRLHQKAIEKGILNANANLSENEKINLIFHPGFSTKSEVSETSGRGVGMDVVKTNIEKLQGEIQIITTVGKGSTFRIHLPLTLAIIDGFVLESSGNRFVIPLSHVHETVQADAAKLKKMEGFGEVFLLRDENLPVYRLNRVLNEKATAKGEFEEAETGIVIRTQAQPFLLIVDRILSQQQIVIKKLGIEAQKNKLFSGSAILGDGRPALILESSEIFQKRPNIGRNAA